MATDIAFAVAALALLGRRVAPGLKVFLLALAIVDDLGAVSVIAVFYTEELHATALLAAGGGLAGAYALRAAGVRSYAVYALVGAGVWLATLLSGVHATVAGVALGLLTPAAALRAGETPPLQVLEHALHPWVAFVVMPVFALANAGVTLDASTLGAAEGRGVALAVAAGLVLGKPLGITLFALVAVRLGLAALPRGVTPGALLGAGLLGGIGFTMALFITALAFGEGPLTSAAKVGVLGASLVSCAGGLVVLARVLPPAPVESARGQAART
jgi:NhaA family Na+:H+ antiporter